MYGQDSGGSGQQPGGRSHGGNGSYGGGGGYKSSGGSSGGYGSSGGGGVAYGGGDSYGGGGGRGGGSGGGRGYGGSSQSRGGGGYQGGDRGGRGGGRGSSDREGDWRCPNPDCGNSNFARRDKCNKCGALPAGTGDRSDRSGGSYNRASNEGGYGNNRGGQVDNYASGRDRGGYGDNKGGRDDSYDGGRGGGYGKGRDDGGYNQRPPMASSYGGREGDSAPQPNAYGGKPDYAPDAVPPPSSYSGGPAAYPPSYGSSGGYGSSRNVTSSFVGSQDEASAKVKQCDENCGETCDNSRIYISNLPPDVTIDELQQLFGSIGLVAKVKQKRGYKDQWPWSIKLYTDEQGNNKGDAVLSFEDPSAAHSAGGFFNNHDMRGHKITVAMAEKSAPKAAPQYGSGQGGGGRGGYGGGDRRRDNYREGGSGPDRNYHGGNRSRPY